MTVHIVQLPFPSTWSPEPDLDAYYRVYERRFTELLPEYFVPDGRLWEMPLWVAHLTALLDQVGLESTFVDLSRMAGSECAGRLLDKSAPGDLILMSPLAQNFDLALQVSRRMRAAGRKCVLGGNMAPLVPPDACHSVFRGQLDVSAAQRLAAIARGAGGPGSGGPGVIRVASPRGLQSQRITWAPNYRHLEGYAGQVPLIRINASHGCLFECDFCGDAWSSQLTLVDRDALRREVDDLIERFPKCRIIYIGDKTFGQSREAVANLRAIFADRPGFKFIVQTHVMQVKPWVIETMVDLGVVVAEMGFESADTAMLKVQNKLSRGLDDYTKRIAALREAGIHVVLNVMGGLDEETAESHRLTVQWQREHRQLLWLCNLYNFVPYPLTPSFAKLRPRIFDWDFANWREDAPVVYKPSHLTVQESWDLFKEKIFTALEVAR